MYCPPSFLTPSQALTHPLFTRPFLHVALLLPSFPAWLPPASSDSRGSQKGGGGAGEALLPSSRGLCPICMDAPMTAVCVPCGHPGVYIRYEYTFPCPCTVESPTHYPPTPQPPNLHLVRLAIVCHAGASSSFLLAVSLWSACLQCATKWVSAKGQCHQCRRPVDSVMKLYLQ